MNIKSIWGVLRTTFQEWQEDNASRLAAALSYYTAVSIAPLLIIVLLVVGLVLGEEAAQGQLMDQINDILGSQGAEFVETIVANADRPVLGSIAGILSLLTLIWGSTNVFGQLQGSLNEIWDIELRDDVGFMHTVKQRLLSFSMVLGIGFLLLISLVVSAGLAAINQMFSNLLPGFDFLWQIVNVILSFLVITGLFAAIYKVLPDVKIEWSDVWHGAAVTGILFVFGKYILSTYLAGAGMDSTYGAAGSVIVFLLWVYYSAQIFFFGAEFTQVYARRYGSGIRPDEDAVYTGDAPISSATGQYANS